MYVACICTYRALSPDRSERRRSQVVDGQAGWTSDDATILSEVVAPRADGKPALLVVNKADIAPDAARALPQEVAPHFSSVVSVSAALGEGLALLDDAVVRALGIAGTAPEGAAWAANQRQARAACVMRAASFCKPFAASDDFSHAQAEALELACAALARLQDAVRLDLPVDFWTIELRDAALALGLVTGADVGDDVLGTIFSRFCIGK